MTWIKDSFIRLAEVCTALIILGGDVISTWWLKLRARMGTRLLLFALWIMPPTQFRAYVAGAINRYMDPSFRG